MKKKVLWAIGAAVVFLGMAAGVIFGSDDPQRVIMFGGGGYEETTYDPPEVSRVFYKRVKDIDVVIHGDVMWQDMTYHEGDRLTWEDGKLVHQSWLQIAHNDIRYWAYRARKKLKGKG